jgi:hypothetical protein
LIAITTMVVGGGSICTDIATAFLRIAARDCTACFRDDATGTRRSAGSRILASSPPLADVRAARRGVRVIRGCLDIRARRAAKLTEQRKSAHRES